MPLSQLYATSTRICQSGTPISNRESAGEADGLFDLGSWKWSVGTAAVSGKRERCGHEPEESDRPYLVDDDGTILALQ
jgi:hypothetical protein